MARVRTGRSTSVKASIVIDGIHVNREAFRRFSEDDALIVLRYLRTGVQRSQANRILTTLNPALSCAQVEAQLCGTTVLRFVQSAAMHKGWPEDVRRHFEELLLPSSVLSSLLPVVCDHFVFALDPMAVTPISSADTSSPILMPGTGKVMAFTVGSNGIPDYIERLCFWLEYALSVYTKPPLSLRNPAEVTGKIMVIVGGAQNTAVSNVIWLAGNHNDNLLAAAAVHELMHCVQLRYSQNALSGEWFYSILEGGAVLAEDFIIDAHNRYIHAGSLAALTQGLIAPPPMYGYGSNESYGFSLFLKYMCEQQSPRVEPNHEPLVGADAYAALLEACGQFGWTSSTLAELTNSLPWGQTFWQFSHRYGETAVTDTLLGNFWLARWLKDFGPNSPDRRFTFMEAEDDVLYDDHFHVNYLNRMPAFNLGTGSALTVGSVLTLASSKPYELVAPFGARYYKVNVANEVDTLRVDFSASTTYADSLVQIVLVEPGEVVRDVLRSDRRQWSRTIANERAGSTLDYIVIVVAGTTSGGAFDLAVSDVSPAPDVMITRWNTRAGNSYEIDPFQWAWTWVSPDIWIDNEGKGNAGSVVWKGYNNKLFVRIRNHGHVDAQNMTIAFSYLDPSAGPAKVKSGNAWLPVRDDAGTIQTVTGATLPAGAVATVQVNWDPGIKTAAQHATLRVQVSVPGDPNSDNKSAMSSFGSIVWNRSAVAEWERPLPVDFPVRTGPHEIASISRSAAWFAPKAIFDSHASTAVTSKHNVSDRVRILARSEVPVRSTRRQHTHDGQHGALSRRPDPLRVYSTDPLALPPGVAEMPMITLVEYLGGRLIGGFSFGIVDPGDPRGRRTRSHGKPKSPRSKQRRVGTRKGRS